MDEEKLYLSYKEERDELNKKWLASKDELEIIRARINDQEIEIQEQRDIHEKMLNFYK